ncbi:MAG TPA: hypothetical protein VF266_26425 [Thermoanaerobaculia bacterium]
MRRTLLLLLVLAAIAPAALGGYYEPRFDRRRVTVNVGETTKVRVTAAYVYFPWIPAIFTPWDFSSENSSIAQVQGMLDAVDSVGTMLITGRKPGRTYARARPWDSTNVVSVTVVCAAEAPVQAAEPRQSTRPGVPVTLRAVTPVAQTTFTWYHGRVGDMSAPIAGSGPELVFASHDHGVQHAWVMATTECSSSTAQFEIEVTSPRRRSARP